MPAESNFSSMVSGRVLVRLDTSWTANGAVFPEGSLVSLAYDQLIAEPDRLKPTVVFVPSARETLESAAATQNRLILTTLDNVKGRAFAYAPEPDGTWSRAPIDLPDNAAIRIVDTDDTNPNVFFSVTSFLTPTALYYGDAASGTFSVVKAGMPKFDASQDVVEQREATSKDGTQIPYFIVHRKDMPADGTTPTILSAYGGFGVSSTPGYDANLGKLWLEGGGSYVLANIRGGGEFGPAWHDAGLKTHRQRIYDDFAAVGRDIIAKRYTSAEASQHIGRLQRRAADGRRVRAASRSLERGVHRSAAARHAAFRKDRCGRVVDRRVRFGFAARRARFPRVDLAVRQRQGRREVSQTVSLHDDQRRFASARSTRASSPPNSPR